MPKDILSAEDIALIPPKEVRNPSEEYIKKMAMKEVAIAMIFLSSLSFALFLMFKRKVIELKKKKIKGD